MKKLKVLLLFDTPYTKPRGYDYSEEFKNIDWDPERYVRDALIANGHEVRILGLFNDIGILFEEVNECRPDVIFNLAEVFNQRSDLDKNIVAVIELLGIPCTGSSSSSLLICGDKALSKTILRFHRIKVPRFYTFYRGRKVWLPKRVRLPLIVKPLKEEASRGISLASVVDSEEALIERVRMIHETMKQDAIVEEYIEGREFYVTVYGNKRTAVLPLREMKFGEMSDDEPRIATYKAKWDFEYREKWKIKNVFAGRVPDGMFEKISDVCKRAYRALNMDAYARFDIRVTAEGRVYIIEANANPNIDRDDEVGQAVEKSGMTYAKFIQKIISLALQRAES
jgi:D-alanine-D-alanine ligase